MIAVELMSPLPPDECEIRLQAAIDLSWFESGTVVGRVSGRSVRLRRRISYKNSFQTFLFGSLEEQDAGAVFRGKTGMHPLVKGFMVVWFCGVVLMGSIAFVATIRAMLAGVGQPMGVVIPLLMLAFGVVLVRFGRWLARNEERFLVTFVASALSAREVTRA